MVVLLLVRWDGDGDGQEDGDACGQLERGRTKLMRMSFLLFYVYLPLNFTHRIREPHPMASSIIPATILPTRPRYQYLPYRFVPNHENPMIKSKISSYNRDHTSTSVSVPVSTTLPHRKPTQTSHPNYPPEPPPLTTHPNYPQLSHPLQPLCPEHHLRPTLTRMGQEGQPRDLYGLSYDGR